MTNRQLEIINESIKLIAERGIQGFTIKNLADALTITEPAIYRHFKSKQQILTSILSQFKENMEVFMDRIQNASPSPFEQLKLIFEWRFKYFAANPAIASVIFSEEIFRNDKLLAEQVFKIMELNQSLLLKIIKAGQRKGEILNNVPANQLALIITGPIRLIVTRWRLSNYDFDLRKEGVKLWKSVELLIKE